MSSAFSIGGCLADSHLAVMVYFVYTGPWVGQAVSGVSFVTGDGQHFIFDCPWTAGQLEVTSGTSVQIGTR